MICMLICTDELDKVTRGSSFELIKDDREAKKINQIVSSFKEWKNVLPPIICIEISPTLGDITIRNIHSGMITFGSGMCLI